MAEWRESPDDIPLAPAPAATTALSELPLDARFPHAPDPVVPAMQRRDWIIGSIYAIGLALSSMWMLTTIAYCRREPSILVALLFLIAIQCGLVYWVCSWSTWSIWLIGLAVPSPIVGFGLGVCLLDPRPLIFGLSLATAPGCARGLHTSINRWRSVRRIRRLTAEQQRELARRTHEVVAERAR